MVFHNQNVGTTVLCYIMTGFRRVRSVDPNSKATATEKGQKKKEKRKFQCWRISTVVGKKNQIILNFDRGIPSGRTSHKATRSSRKLSPKNRGFVLCVGNVRMELLTQVPQIEGYCGTLTFSSITFIIKM